MLVKVLRFIGAIVLSFAFSYLVDVSTISFFAGTAHFFANLSFSNWMGFDLLRGVLIPILFTIMIFAGMGVIWLVKGSKIIAIIPIIIFIVSICTEFLSLFIYPIELITQDIGAGFWYYTGAVITFLEMILCYTVCSLGMLESNED